MSLPVLELDDIQSGALRPRPTPFAATYIILRIDDRNAGRDLMRRLGKVVASAAGGKAGTGHLERPLTEAQGARRSPDSLDSFHPVPGGWRRAKNLGDVGDSRVAGSRRSARPTCTSCSPRSRPIPRVWSPLCNARALCEKLSGIGDLATGCHSAG
jgi:hypothetical protein